MVGGEVAEWILFAFLQTRLLGQGEGGDAGHDFVGEVLVEVFGGEVGEGGEVGFVEVTDDEGDGGRVEAFGAAGEGLIGAVDADWEDGGGGFGDEEADTGFGGEEVAVVGAGAFREHEDAAAGFEEADGGLEAGGIRFVAVDGDGLPAAEDGADEGIAEEGFAGEEVDGFVEGLADEGGVEEGDVVAADEGGAFEVEAGLVDDAEVKQAMGGLAEDSVADGVAEVHLDCGMRNGDCGLVCRMGGVLGGGEALGF